MKRDRVTATELRARDERLMARCIELARQGEGHTAPNPLVGCVITDPDGDVVAEGYHRRLGGLHAEAEALAAVGGKAPGCTAYVNLEPCNHRKNRRTSPCAPALAEAGIARLVIGMGDPIRSHAGGARWLARHGVEVSRNVLRDQCADLNRAFVTWAKLGRPLVVLKAGITLDGKIATQTGQSQWITGPAARRDAHRLRHCHQAIMVGIGTVLADDPRLTVRGVRGGRDPVRIVVDSRLRTPPRALVLPQNSTSRARVIIATTQRAAAARQRRLEDAGAEVWRAGGGPEVNLTGLLGRLGNDEIISVMVEGGATLHSALLDADLADEIALYMAPFAVGGASLSWVRGRGIDALAEARRFRFDPPRQLGNDLLVVAKTRRIGR
ncbi:MAG: bifunctional diaminohydroxyphosphoribosylaminopyrimidine deaminase/5-amino-6-(5-phosphoribosylamino)uracil reductase RibD [Proteobacteria bacterium]|nr:bifunctional diaminohydroxyphosphoribosylaminopyrimidine deaminase/5-amino-6-(5-phosphoribosylamino)uracil reductase RibD [Pseudomonadota bacterium]